MCLLGQLVPGGCQSLAVATPRRKELDKGDTRCYGVGECVGSELNHALCFLLVGGGGGGGQKSSIEKLPLMIYTSPNTV